MTLVYFVLLFIAINAVYVNSQSDCPSYLIEGKGLYLNCSNRGFTNVHLIMSGNFYAIDLSHNAISDANQVRIEIDNLRELDLSHNQLGNSFNNTSLPIGGDKFMTLQKLNLSNNRIKQLSKAFFSELSNLRELDLSSNQLKSIEFYIPQSLETIWLDVNPIEVIKKNDFLLTNLVKLHLSNLTSLQEIEAYAFSHLKNLESLFLNHNNLKDYQFLAGEKINPNATYYEKLERVEIVHNKLINLAPNSIPWKKLKYLNATGNNLMCDFYDLSWLEEKSNFEYKCHDIDVACDRRPFGKQGFWKDFRDLGNRHLGWTIGIGVFLLVLMIVLVAVSCCVASNAGKRHDDRGIDNEMHVR